MATQGRASVAGRYPIYKVAFAAYTHMTFLLLLPTHMFEGSKFIEDRPYIIIPETSSEKRKYVPIGFVKDGMIPGNAIRFIPSDSLYLFGVLTSSIHMDWMRAVGGRLEMRYKYSNDIVYNTFPWCNPTKEQKEKIEKTAQTILDARKLYPDSSLADMYDPDNDWMYPELTKAHRENDKAVMEAYGFNEDVSEPIIIAELFKMYQILINDRK